MHKYVWIRLQQLGQHASYYKSYYRPNESRLDSNDEDDSRNTNFTIIAITIVGWIATALVEMEVLVMPPFAVAVVDKILIEHAEKREMTIRFLPQQWSLPVVQLDRLASIQRHDLVDHDVIARR